MLRKRFGLGNSDLNNVGLGERREYRLPAFPLVLARDLHRNPPESEVNRAQPVQIR